MGTLTKELSVCRGICVCVCVHMCYGLKTEDKLSRPNMEPPHETTFQLSGWASSREMDDWVSV